MDREDQGMSGEEKEPEGHFLGGVVFELHFGDCVRFEHVEMMRKGWAW